MEKEAIYFSQEGDVVVCELCPRYCRLRDGSRGFCRQKQNKDAKLYAINYAKVASVAIDPIEKKPLYHFYPGKEILSVGTIGCNFRCLFCQNWQISQQDAPTRIIPPQELIRLAQDNNSFGIAYTYSEPLIWYEYVLDTAKLARSAGLRNVLVTNGFINKDPLTALLPYIDAANIDLKAFSADFYKKYCQGEFYTVIENIKLMKKYLHIELTNLIIPTLNDDICELKELINFVSGELGEDTPLHLSRYFPHYKLNIEPTPLETLKQAYELASTALLYVYIGNVWDRRFNTTYCPSCRRGIIVRDGFFVSTFDIKKNNNSRRCKYCNEEVNIIC